MRRKIKQDYNEFAQGYENKTMDDLCRSTGQFELQVQQKFLKKLVHEHPMRPILLYHGIGSGKTCTSITIAEETMKLHPTKKILVILPARLKSNFINELMSQCSEGAYITEQEFTTYMNPATSSTLKKRIYKRFLENVGNNYTIMSFERFRISVMKSTNPKEYLKDLTRDKLVIIDEVHNLINPALKYETLEFMENGGKPGKKTKAIHSLLLFLMARTAYDSTQFVYMTATPIFDNIKQMILLAKIMNPNQDLEDILTPKSKIEDVIPYFAKKVSYFPGSSPKAYPSVSYEMINVEPSDYQYTLLKLIRPYFWEKDDEISNSFFSLERQVSIFSHVTKEIAEDVNAPKDYKRTLKETIKLALNNPERYMPKLVKIFEKLELPGKHLVYSNFVTLGGTLLGKLLKKRGWVSFKDVLDGKVSNPTPYKCFAIWDGKTSDTNKDSIKTVANSIDNIDGKMLKLVIGSPAMKEGVSFKHIQHYHIIDPVWNQSTRTQVEGRAIRFCSHFDISENDPILKRHVVIHQYKLLYPEAVDIATTKKLIDEISIDSWIYDKVIPRKYKKVKVAESALRRVSIDYYLFRKLYKSQNKSTPELDSKVSIFSLSEQLSPFESEPENKRKEKKPPTTCMPKSRQPPCEEGFDERPNKHGDPCCFKETRAKRKPKVV